MSHVKLLTPEKDIRALFQEQMLGCLCNFTVDFGNFGVSICVFVKAKSEHQVLLQNYIFFQALHYPYMNLKLFFWPMYIIFPIPLRTSSHTFMTVSYHVMV